MTTKNEYIEQWYRKIDVLYEIVKNLKKKEVVFLNTKDTNNTEIVRGLFLNMADRFSKAIKTWDLMLKEYNVYYSVAYYDMIPLFDFIPYIRREQMKVWNEEHIKHITGYDLVFDFDMKRNAKNIRMTKAYKEVKTLKKVFDEHFVRYNICFSGGGWHIRIPKEFMYYVLEMPERDKILDIYKTIVISLKEMFNLSTLDTTIYDTRRIWKAEYTIDFQRNIVLYPLSDEEFKNFEVDYVRPKNLVNKAMYNRGMMFKRGDKVSAKTFFKILKK